jgi:predicted  nucleic acid-binding Zn-ribbon protein
MAQLIGQGPQQDEDENQQQQVQGPISAPSQVSGQPSQVAGTQQAKPAPKGTGFTNLAKVKQANLGAGQRLAQAATGNVSQQAANTQQQLANMYQQYSQNIQKGAAPKYDQTRAQNVVQSIQSGQNVDPADMDWYKSVTGYTYGGPTGVTGADEQTLATQQAQARQARLKAMQTLSETGRSDLLLQSGLRGQQTYTPGMSRLDQIFFGAKPARQELSALRGLTGKVEAEAQGLGSKIAQEAKAVKEAGEESDKAATGLATKAREDITKSLAGSKQKFTTDEQTKQAAIAKAAEDLRAGRPVNQESLVASGLSKEDAALVSGLFDASVLDNPDEVVQAASEALGFKSGQVFDSAGNLVNPGDLQDIDFANAQQAQAINRLASLTGDTSNLSARRFETGHGTLDRSKIKAAVDKNLGKYVQEDVAAENELRRLQSEFGDVSGKLSGLQGKRAALVQEMEANRDNPEYNQETAANELRAVDEQVSALGPAAGYFQEHQQKQAAAKARAAAINKYLKDRGLA